MIHEHDWMFTKQRKFKYCSILYFNCRYNCGTILNKVIPPVGKSLAVDDIGRVSTVKDEPKPKKKDTFNITIPPRGKAKYSRSE